MTTLPATESVTLKEDRLQLVTDLKGDIREANGRGHGLYLNDTRHLSVFELLVNDLAPIYLSHSAERNYIATFQFINPAFVLGDGTRVPNQTISIRRSRFVDGESFRERLGFYNCNHFAVELEVRMNFDADFLDMFAVRGYTVQKRGGHRSVRFSEAV